MAVFRGPSVDVINVLQPPSESLPGSQAPNFSKTGDAFVTTHIEHAGDLHTGRLTLIDSPQNRETHNSSAREFESQLGQPELTIIPESGSEQNLSNLHGSPQSIAGNVRKDEVSQAKSALPLSEQNGTDEAHKADTTHGGAATGARALTKAALTKTHEVADFGDSAFRYHMQTRKRSIPLSYDGSDGKLHGQLFHSLCVLKEAFNGKGFIPKQQLLKLVNESAVEHELIRYEASLRKRHKIWRLPSTAAPATADEIKAEARKICGPFKQVESSEKVKDEHQPEQKSYQKILAILLLIEQPSKIRTFMEEGVCDADLPLVKGPRSNGHPGSISLCRRDDPLTPLQCFKSWRHSRIIKFEEWQWALLAPFFAWGSRKNVPHYLLPPKTILPFTKFTKIKESGGFGQVYEALIHHEHHTFGDTTMPSKNTFAIKQLNSTLKVDFEREVRVLKVFSGNWHPHLISLLATYNFNGRYYLIFPWANSDLLKYWRERQPEPIGDKENAIWLAEQCRGIAEGLTLIHRYETFSGKSLLHPDSMQKLEAQEAKMMMVSGQTGEQQIRRVLFGRHGDIKPSNILWFEEGNNGRGILKITDFGIAEFRTSASTPMRDRGPVMNSPTYRAPECDLPDGVASTLYDTWALGCVYIEFITWSFGGWASIEAFKQSRLSFDEYWGGMGTDTFFRIESDSRKAALKESVTNKIYELQSHPCCTAFFYDFLTMIKNDLLVVEHDALAGGKTGRKSSGNIARELATICENCTSIPDYAASFLNQTSSVLP